MLYIVWKALKILTPEYETPFRTQVKLTAVNINYFCFWRLNHVHMH